MEALSLAYTKWTYLSRTRSASGGKGIGVGVHIYLPVRASEQGKVFGVCGQFFFLNHTLAIDSPFQTFVVGLLIKFID